MHALSLVLFLPSLSSSLRVLREGSEVSSDFGVLLTAEKRRLAKGKARCGRGALRPRPVEANAKQASRERKPLKEDDYIYRMQYGTTADCISQRLTVFHSG